MIRYESAHLLWQTHHIKARCPQHYFNQVYTIFKTTEIIESIKNNEKPFATERKDNMPMM